MDHEGTGRDPEGGPADDEVDAIAHLIHEEFADPGVIDVGGGDAGGAAPVAPPRFYRVGALAVLAVLGLLLAVVVVVSPGGSKPRLPVQTVHDLGPVTTVPRIGTTTTTAPSVSSTIPSAVAPATSEGNPSGAVVTPAAAPAPTSTSGTHLRTDASAQRSSTTTTTTIELPPPTTTTTLCFLGAICVSR